MVVPCLLRSVIQTAGSSIRARSAVITSLFTTVKVTGF